MWIFGLAFPGVEEGSPPLEQGKGPNEKKSGIFPLMPCFLVRRVHAL